MSHDSRVIPRHRTRPLRTGKVAPRIPVQPPGPNDGQAGRDEPDGRAGHGDRDAAVGHHAERDGADSSQPPGGLLGRVGGLAEFCYRRLGGDYEVDEFGFDRQFTDTLLLPALRAVYQHWFRVEVSGAENIPADGPGLLVANHSGTLPWDAVMTAVAVHEHSTGNRYLRELGADLLFALPVLGTLVRKSGHTLACGADAERLLRSGALVGVWPEGFKGVGKPFAERYKLQRFGRGGFVGTALRTGAPIVPVSIVGAEEIHPKLADLRVLARLLRLPYFPITPTFPLLGPLGAIPLPTKWHIHFGEPIHTDALGDPDDSMLRFNLTDQVRQTIQDSLYGMLAQRRDPFTG